MQSRHLFQTSFLQGTNYHMLEDKTETNKSPTLEMIMKYWYGLVYKNPLKFFTNINF